MPTFFHSSGDDQFLVSIAYDKDFGEYQAVFINQNYKVRLLAPTESRVKYKTMRLLRDYVGIDQAMVIFRNDGIAIENHPTLA